MKYRGVSEYPRSNRYSVAVWDSGRHRQAFGGSYETAIEAAIAYDIIKLTFDRRDGQLTDPEKLNFCDKYEIVLSTKEQRTLRLLTASAMALNGGPRGPGAVAARNKFLLRAGQVSMRRA